MVVSLVHLAHQGEDIGDYSSAYCRAMCEKDTKKDTEPSESRSW